MAQLVIDGDGTDGMDVDVPPPPPLDAEEEVVHLMELLDPNGDNLTGDEVGDGSYSERVAAQLQVVAAMSHNKQLLRDLHNWLHQFIRRAQQQQSQSEEAAAEQQSQLEAARTALNTIKSVYNIIVSKSPVGSAYRELALSRASSAMIYKALLDVGVGARPEPFPQIRARQAKVIRTQVYSAVTGELEESMEADGLFEVLVGTEEDQITNNSDNSAAGSSSAWCMVQTIRKAIHGRVRRAMVLRKEITTAGQVRFMMTDQAVAIKEMGWESIRAMEARNALNENPKKEIAGMQYITDRMSGRVEAPHLRGQAEGVLPIIECLSSNRFIYSIMPFLEEELFMTVENFRQVSGERGFPERDACRMLTEILSGLNVLHSLGLAHHDISLENLMLDAPLDQGGRCVIIDLGMIVKVPQRGPDKKPVKIIPSTRWPCRCGKMLYMAPEVLNPREPFNPLALDMWAVGITLFILLTGVPPWDVETGPSVTDQRFLLVRNGRLEALLNAWNFHLSPDAVDILQSLLRVNVDTRLTIAETLTHPWVTNNSAT